MKAWHNIENSIEEFSHHGTTCIYCRDIFHVSFHRQQCPNALESISNERFTLIQQAEHCSGQYRQSGLLGLRAQLTGGACLLVALLLHDHQPHHVGANHPAQLQAEK
jgi:hypothetical protein